MALLEAMAAQVPVIATRVGELPGMLRAGESGMLVPPSDSEALADGILRYLHDPVAAKQAAAWAYKDVVEHHSSTAMAGKYAALYQSIASTRVNNHG